LRFFGGNFGLPDLPDPENESVSDTLHRVPEDLEALLAAAAPLVDVTGKEKPLTWEERMRLHEVLYFIEGLSAYYRAMDDLLTENDFVVNGRARETSSPRRTEGTTEQTD